MDGGGRRRRSRCLSLSRVGTCEQVTRDLSSQGIRDLNGQGLVAEWRSLSSGGLSVDVGGRRNLSSGSLSVGVGRQRSLSSRGLSVDVGGRGRAIRFVAASVVSVVDLNARVNETDALRIIVGMGVAARLSLVVVVPLLLHGGQLKRNEPVGNDDKWAAGHLSTEGSIYVRNLLPGILLRMV